jgi:hypothetical protein
MNEHCTLEEISQPERRKAGKEFFKEASRNLILIFNFKKAG